MAWAFVVEDGSQVDDATSYVSVADATEYYTPDTTALTAWLALSDTAQKHLLSWATRVLDQKVEWEGSKTADDQALRWPRANVYDRDGLLIDDDTIPKQLVEATLEMAKYLLENDPTTGQDVDFLQRLRVDVIEIDWQPNTSQSNFPSLINMILQPLGTMSNGVLGFVRIVKS